MSASAGVFLGTLRSEFDEPAALPAVFARLLADVEAVLDDHRNGTLDEHATAETLAGLTLTDADGAQWTLGATTRRWYRRTRGGSWLPTPPPAASGGEVAASFELDDALLSTMTRSAASMSSLDAPSDQYRSLHELPAASPTPTASAAVLPDGVASVLELHAPEPTVRSAPAVPAIRAAGDIPTEHAAPQPDGVAPVLELDAIAAETAHLSPTPADVLDAGPRVWPAPDGVPADAVPLPEGLSSTLALHLPEEPAPAVVPEPERDPAAATPQRSGFSLEELLSGYTPAPKPADAATEVPGRPDRAPADDVAAMLAELMVTAPAAADDDEDFDADLP